MQGNSSSKFLSPTEYAQQLRQLVAVVAQDAQAVVSRYALAPYPAPPLQHRLMTWAPAESW